MSTSIPIVRTESGILENLQLKTEGDAATPAFRIYAHNSVEVPADLIRQEISMWHDIPLHPSTNVVNMICEV